MLDPFSLSPELIDNLLMVGLLAVAIGAFALSRKASHDLSEDHWDTDHMAKL